MNFAVKEEPMKEQMLHEELIQLDMEAKDQNDFFEKMSAKLQKLGYVEDTFLEAIKLRESKYPTALPTEPHAIAIPHADPVNIKKQFIAFTRLKNPVKWCEMATNDSWHDVKLIFMLGFKRDEGHIEVLQILLDSFQDPKLMDKLINAKSNEEMMTILSSIKGLN